MDSIDFDFLYPGEERIYSLPKLEEMNVCITTKEEFVNKLAYVFEDIDAVTNYDIGRKYKPRKRLTEIINGNVLTDESVVESRVALDYYTNPYKFSRNLERENVISFDNPKGATFKKRISVPHVEDRLTMVGLNIHESDIISVRQFDCTVVAVYPFILEFDIKTKRYIKKFSPTRGVIEVEIDYSSLKQKRSIVLPPLIPKRVAKSLIIV